MEVRPPGFRFYPTEEELLAFYLQNKLHGRRIDMHHIIPVVSIYDIEPWCLPELSGELCQRDTEQWFFFVPRQERESRGGRPTRSTPSGYWKATGSPNYVYSSENKVIGLKKTMVFYRGKAPAGKKTKWKMNEYRAIDQAAGGSTGNIPQLRTEFTLCRVYVTSGNLRAFDRRPMRPAVGVCSVKLLESSESSGFETTTNPQQPAKSALREATWENQGLVSPTKAE